MREIADRCRGMTSDGGWCREWRGLVWCDWGSEWLCHWHHRKQLHPDQRAYHDQACAYREAGAEGR